MLRLGRRRWPALAGGGVLGTLVLAFGALALTTGGTTAHAQPQATSAARAASTLAAICRTSTAGATAVAQAAQQCQAIAAVTPTPTPPALVVFAAPSVKTGLVGDVVAPAGVPLHGLYPPIFGDRVALGMDGLWDTLSLIHI